MLGWIQSHVAKRRALTKLSLSQEIRIEIASIHEAESQLSWLIEQAMNGEEVVIAKAGRPMVRLVPIQPDTSPRRGSQWKGRVRMAEDFDSLPDVIAAAFGIDRT
jgi:prevent-host-death family protein